MLIVIGESACPGCGRVIEATDDCVPVTPHETVRAIPVGAYHRECLAIFPERERVVAKWRDNMVASVRRRGDSTSVIGQGRGYVIVFNSADEQVILYYLNQMANQRFIDLPEWRDFATLVKGFDPTNTEPRDVVSRLGISTLAARAGGQVVLSWVEPVSLEIDLAKANYEAYVAQFGPLRGEVNFGELVAAGKLSPVQVEGSLEKNRGVVQNVRSLGDLYIVTFDASKRIEIPLTVADFRELQQTVKGVKGLA
jgi:hypothetical protein